MEAHTAETKTETTEKQRPRFGWRQMVAALAAEYDSVEEVQEAFLERTSQQAVNEAALESVAMEYGRLTKPRPVRAKRDPSVIEAENAAFATYMEQMVIGDTILENGKKLKDSSREDVAVSMRLDYWRAGFKGKILAKLEPGQIVSERWSDAELDELK